MRRPQNPDRYPVLRKLAGSDYALSRPVEMPDSAIDRGAMAVLAVITTDAEDRSRDVVRTSGIITTQHRLNPVVLLEHGEKHLTSIAQSESPSGEYGVKLYDDYGTGRGYFSQTCPVAEQVFALLDEGVMRGASIGFRPLKAKKRHLYDDDGYTDEKARGLEIESCELLEWSIVSLPDNPRCLVAATEILHKNRLNGRPLLDTIRKSLLPYATPVKRNQVVGGFSPRGVGKSHAPLADSASQPSWPAVIARAMLLIAGKDAEQGEGPLSDKCLAVLDALRALRDDPDQSAFSGPSDPLFKSYTAYVKEWQDRGEVNGGPRHRWYNPALKQSRTQIVQPGTGRATTAARVAERKKMTAEAAHEQLSGILSGASVPEDAVERVRSVLGGMYRDEVRKLAKKVGALGSLKLKQMVTAVAEAAVEKVKAGNWGRAEPVADAGGSQGVHEPGDAVNMPTDELHVDPGRFQFKLNVNREGVTEEFKEVDVFNPDFAGVISVWKDPADGKTYVINGHHRYEMARRLGHPRLAVRYIKASDHERARALGALINIAEGRGTALDAAKFIRDSGTSADTLKKYGLSFSGKLASEASILARLSPRMFNELLVGRLDQGKALAVGAHLPDHDRQDELFAWMQKKDPQGKKFGPTVVAEMAAEMAATPTVQSDDDGMFPGFGKVEDSLFAQRAELKAFVRSEMAKEFNDFSKLASERRAANVSRVEGNTLNTDENRRMAQELGQVRDTYAALVNYRGPISDTINAAAEEYAKAKTERQRNDIKQQAIERVRQLATSQKDSPVLGSGSERTGRAGPGDSEGQPAGPPVTPAEDARGGGVAADGLSGPEAAIAAQQNELRGQLATYEQAYTAAGGTPAAHQQALKAAGLTAHGLQHARKISGKFETKDPGIVTPRQGDDVPKEGTVREDGHYFAQGLWHPPTKPVTVSGLPESARPKPYQEPAKPAVTPASKPVADGAQEAAKLPSAVRTTIQHAVGALKDREDALANARQTDSKFQGGGRYEWEADQKFQTPEALRKLAQARERIQQFRELAGDNGVDADAVLAHLGHGPQTGPVSDTVVKPVSKPTTKMPADHEEFVNPSHRAKTLQEWADAQPTLDNPGDNAAVAAHVAQRLADGYRLPRAVIEAHPEIVQSHIDATRKASEADHQQLAAIKPGDTGFLGGYYVQRKGPNSYRTETPDGYVEGPASKVLAHIKQQQGANLGDRRSVEDALGRHSRTAASEAEGLNAAGGPGVEALRKLAPGTRLVVTGGGYRGRTAKLVKEKDPESGRIRLMLDLDGSPERIPANHTNVEPLDPSQSWRRQQPTVTRPQAAQGELLTAEQGRAAARPKGESAPAATLKPSDDFVEDFASQQGLFDEGGRQHSLFGAARKSYRKPEEPSWPALISQAMLLIASKDAESGDGPLSPKCLAVLDALKAMQDDPDQEAFTSPNDPLFKSYAAWVKGWSKLQTTRGGNKWKNDETGTEKYFPQNTDPNKGKGGERTNKEGVAQRKEQKQQVTAEAAHGHMAGIFGEGDVPPDAATKTHALLDGMYRDEVRKLAREFGQKLTGSKDELITRVAAAAVKKAQEGGWKRAPSVMDDMSERWEQSRQRQAAKGPAAPAPAAPAADSRFTPETAALDADRYARAAAVEAETLKDLDPSDDPAPEKPVPLGGGRWGDGQDERPTPPPKPAPMDRPKLTTRRVFGNTLGAAAIRARLAVHKLKQKLGLKSHRPDREEPDYASGTLLALLSLAGRLGGEDDDAVRRAMQLTVDSLEDGPDPDALSGPHDPVFKSYVMWKAWQRTGSAGQTPAGTPKFKWRDDQTGEVRRQVNEPKTASTKQKLKGKGDASKPEDARQPAKGKPVPLSTDKATADALEAIKGHLEKSGDITTDELQSVADMLSGGLKKAQLQEIARGLKEQGAIVSGTNALLAKRIADAMLKQAKGDPQAGKKPAAKKEKPAAVEEKPKSGAAAIVAAYNRAGDRSISQEDYIAMFAPLDGMDKPELVQAAEKMGVAAPSRLSAAKLRDTLKDMAIGRRGGWQRAQLINRPEPIPAEQPEPAPAKQAGPAATDEPTAEPPASPRPAPQPAGPPASEIQNHAQFHSRLKELREEKAGYYGFPTPGLNRAIAKYEEAIKDIEARHPGLSRPAGAAPPSSPPAGGDRGSVPQPEKASAPVTPKAEPSPAPATVKPTPAPATATAAVSPQQHALATLTKLKEKTPLHNPSLPALYDALSPDGSMDPGEFHDTLRDLAAAGAVKLHPFTRPTGYLERGELGMMGDQEIKYYVQPTGKPLPAGGAAPARKADTSAARQEASALLRGKNPPTTLPELYDRLKGHGLSVGQFHGIVRDLAKSGEATLKTSTKQGHQLQNSHLLMMHGQNIVDGIEGTGKGEAKPAATPPKKGKKPPAFPASGKGHAPLSATAYKGTAAGGGMHTEQPGTTRFGPGSYFHTKEGVAQYYAQEKGGQVVSAPVAVHKPYLPEGDNDPDTAEGQLLVAGLQKEFGMDEQHARETVAQGDLFHWAKMRSRGGAMAGEPAGSIFPGADAANRLLRNAGYDGVAFKDHRNGGHEVVRFVRE